jgi:hypothetical protein
MDMLWPNFALQNNAFTLPEPPLQTNGSGFSMQPWADIGDDFDVPSAYQPHYGTTNGST